MYNCKTRRLLSIPSHDVCSVEKGIKVPGFLPRG